jgi:hypothetical protein
MQNLGSALHMRMVRVVNMRNFNGSHENGREEKIPTREDGPYIFPMLIVPTPCLHNYVRLDFLTHLHMHSVIGFQVKGGG